MMNLSSPGIQIALSAVAAGLLVVLVKLFWPRPKRAEKWEKAEIMKKLLALSDQQEGRRLPAPAVRTRVQPARPVARPGMAHVKASAKVSPVRAKAR